MLLCVRCSCKHYLNNNTFNPYPKPMGGEYYHHLYCVEWEERLSNLPKVIKLVRGQEFESVKLVLQACAFPAVLN